MLPTIVALPPAATDPTHDGPDSNSDHASDQGDSTKDCTLIPTQAMTQDWTHEQPLHADAADHAAEDAAPPCSGVLSLLLRTAVSSCWLAAGGCAPELA